MKKISFLFIICLIFLGLNTSNAQIKLVLNGGVQFPTGDFKTLVPGVDTKMGFGGTVDGEYTISNSPTSTIAITASVGYNRWSFDTPSSFTGEAYIDGTTIMGGAKYFFQQFYFGGSAGIVNPGMTVTGLTMTFDSEFIWSVSAGTRIDKFDINAKYYSFSSAGVTLPWFGVNVGYVFDL